MARRAPLLAALALCLCAAQPLSAQSLRISAEDGPRAAFTLLYNGYAQAAADLARALIARDPSDLEAHLALSRAERVLGNFEAATAAGKSAWALADTDEERFAAALVTAQALSSEGKRTRAMLWLRRAAQEAPDEARKAQAMRDFRYVRGRNPFSTTLSFTSRPSSNINNGSKSDTLIIDGLPFVISGDARALSGLEVVLGASTAYTRRVSENRLLRFGGRFETRHYALSSEAKAQAPDQDASDYSYTEIEATIGATQLRDPRLGITDLSFDIGRAWYGGDPLANFLRGTIEHRQRLGRSITGTYSLSLTSQQRLDSSTQDSTDLFVLGNWAMTGQSGGVLGWNLGARDMRSQSATISHNALIAGISYQPRAEIFGTRGVLSLDVEQRSYDKPLFGTMREDTRTRLGVTLLLDGLEYYGFAPTLNMSYTRTKSNISLYDTEEIGVNIGLRSTF
ncbi:hypothetical protein PSA7680_01154 [Pseudoruegeria aquimaris]|uniref:Surface lipoprotein assembly modifier C-terminal domain-containing protein n=1 Tax=Pseudoruegeria aquimaris TaxID=393663 RepID=A0A1Y5RVE4_9RHOB|nr:surface lipoprotein assembly modifier [Pseudoruegeria aquimaris]SLN26436.1 hypothetical protein PSA7680_01154 [Pseudoruegeria aquimaris]